MSACLDCGRRCGCAGERIRAGRDPRQHDGTCSCGTCQRLRAERAEETITKIAALSVFSGDATKIAREFLIGRAALLRARGEKP